MGGMGGMGARLRLTSQGRPCVLRGGGCLLLDQAEHGDGVVVCVLVALVADDLPLVSLHDLGERVRIGRVVSSGRAGRATAALACSKRSLERSYDLRS
jgi:hypothetical protein